jgi:hypothetical protein
MSEFREPLAIAGVDLFGLDAAPAGAGAGACPATENRPARGALSEAEAARRRTVRFLERLARLADRLAARQPSATAAVG